MPITLDLPQDLERRLREKNPDLDDESKIAVALDLFRKEQITHIELGRMLSLDRLETDALLVARKEYAQSLSLEDLENDYRTLSAYMVARGE